MEKNLPPFPPGLGYGQTDFERRQGPSPIMHNRLVLEQRLVHLLHLERTGAASAKNRDLPATLVTIDVDAVRRLANVAALEARNRETEPVNRAAAALVRRCRTAADA